MSIKTKMKSSRESVAKEYAMVNANPIVRGSIQAAGVVIDILLMFLLIWNVFKYFIPFGSWINVVDGESMYPTLKDGQIVFTETANFGRGDIVTTHVPEHLESQVENADRVTFIKRIIGVPGDIVQITNEGVFINGERYYEEYLTVEAQAATYKIDGVNSVKLGAGEYYIMGDNRGASFDSRSFGKINAEKILYKQSAKPTQNFWLKTAFIVIIFALDMCLYALVEFVLTETAYAILYGKKAKAQKLEEDKKRNGTKIPTTSQTVFIEDKKN